MKKAFYDTRADEDEDIDFGPSKSQKKRDSDLMQKLGGELARLPADQFARIDLPEDIRQAIVDYQRMKSFGAMRRQMQLIGKLMRRLEASAVREAIDRATGESRAAVAAHHRAEKARASARYWSAGISSSELSMTCIFVAARLTCTLSKDKSGASLPSSPLRTTFHPSSIVKSSCVFRP